MKRAQDMIKLDLQEPMNMTEERGIWIVGPPRVGKSYLARTAFGPYYVKA